MIKNYVFKCSIFHVCSRIVFVSMFAVTWQYCSSGGGGRSSRVGVSPPGGAAACRHSVRLWKSQSVGCRRPAESSESRQTVFVCLFVHVIEPIIFFVVIVCRVLLQPV